MLLSLKVCVTIAEHRRISHIGWRIYRRIIPQDFKISIHKKIRDMPLFANTVRQNHTNDIKYDKTANRHLALALVCAISSESKEKSDIKQIMLLNSAVA